MIVKINFGEKPYFSHVFLMGITQYRERFVVFNDKLEKFELVCATKELDLSNRCIYTFDYTYEGFIKKDLIELIKSIDVEDELGKEKVKKNSEEDDEETKRKQEQRQSKSQSCKIRRAYSKSKKRLSREACSLDCQAISSHRNRRP